LEAGRLTDMAPETVCMLVAWVETVEATELRATCWTLKHVVDEVVPWMVRRHVAWESGMQMAVRLAATEAGAMRRTMLHTTEHPAVELWDVMREVVQVGDVRVLAYMHDDWCTMDGCEWEGGFCATAVWYGRLDALIFLRSKGHRWPMTVCDYVRWSGPIRPHERAPIMEWMHAGARKTWPCHEKPCRWAREYRANEL